MNREEKYKTSKLVETLLDDADYFGDVESFALEHHGFTPENLQECVAEFLQTLPYGVDVENVEWGVAARSLNEEFGYERHSKRVFLRLHSVRVDEIDRERCDIDLVSPEWSPGDDIDVFLEKVQAIVRILLREAKDE
jgi:hypothetical protein